MVNTVIEAAREVIVRQVVKALTFGLYLSHSGELLGSFK